jgi:predicted DsbA family dithiol-disulfide isomerase
MRTVVEVEIWSDVVCPWCYIGKRRFERAVEEVADDIEVRTMYRPYQLDPSAPTDHTTPVSEAYAKKFGGPERALQIIDHLTAVAAEDDIEFHLDRALRANTLLAHRLLWLAEAAGRQDDLKEALLRAYFVDGLDIGDVEVLADAAQVVGYDREPVLRFLASDDGRAEVETLLHHARENGITAVPTYIVGVAGATQTWMIPGAQDTDVFVSVLRRLAERSNA